MKSTYYVDRIKEGSVCVGERTVDIVEGTYKDAINKAHEIWSSLSRKAMVTVHSTKRCNYYWYCIYADGTIKNRNVVCR